MFRLCCEADLLAKSQRKDRYEPPNRVRLTEDSWTQIEIDRPSLVLPISNMTGFLLAYPGMRALQPEEPSAAVFTNMDTVHTPGGASLFLPVSGMWSIYNFTDVTLVEIVDAKDPGMNELIDCGVGCWTSNATETHTQVTVGTTSVTALNQNPFSVYRRFVNDSVNVIYLSLDGAAATTNSGIRLNPNGGTYEMSRRYGNLLWWLITAIATAATSELLVTEGGINPFVT
mgnify:CR=1 FL=1